jgi:asparagine synthase (glutamine-hydrolysing)
MCGIAGIYGTGKLTNAGQALDAMVHAIDHRGPDASGTFLSGDVALGHTRLSIIDLSPDSNQPFTSSDGRFTMVFNGEIYNYLEIKAELAGSTFRTNSDTEVLLETFIQWDTGAFQKVNGMFACAIWDNRESRLVLVRDRIGIKPLYYAQVNDQLVFGSEIRALLASGIVPRKLNKAVLSEYLMYQTVHAPQTMVEGVKMLEPGTYIDISPSDYKVAPYWKPWQNLHQDNEPILIQKRIRELLTKSVERRLIADVPVGAFLSGGIDSSLLVGIVSERLGQKLDTFNVSFDESEYSEAKYAREIAQKFETNHHEIQLKPSDLLEALPEGLASMDHPSGDGLNSWIVSRETKKQGLSVALSGLGGDEVFAGYDVFQRIPRISDNAWLLSFPKALRVTAGHFAKMYRPGIPSSKLAQILKLDYFDLESLYPIFRKVLLDHQVKGLLGKKPFPNAVNQSVQMLEEFDGYGKLPTLSRISIAEMNTYMQNVLLRDTDQMSMAHALEVRVPFLDHELIEYVTHVSDQVKYPHTPKQLLVSSFQDILPSSITSRKKMGFVLPWEDWMKGDLREFCQENIDQLVDSGLMNASAVQGLWKDFLDAKGNVSWSRVWPIIVLSQWMKLNEIEA